MQPIIYEGKMLLKIQHNSHNRCYKCYFLRKPCPSYNFEHECYVYDDAESRETYYFFKQLKRDKQPVRFLKILLRNILIGSNNQWRRW